MRKVAGSRDSASLMAVFNPRALVEFMCDDIGMYVTPNGSGFRTGDIPLVHPTSDRVEDQPLGMVVWDLSMSVPHGKRRPSWAHEVFKAKRDGTPLPTWARFSSPDDLKIDGSGMHTTPFQPGDTCIWNAEFYGRQWEYAGTVGGMYPNSKKFWYSKKKIRFSKII